MDPLKWPFIMCIYFYHPRETTLPNLRSSSVVSLRAVFGLDFIHATFEVMSGHVAEVNTLFY